MREEVAVHYSGSSGLIDRIVEALRRDGKDPAHVTADDLAGVDEFHIRGRKATLELAGQMRLHKGAEVLDIGSGLGGPARALAAAYGCRVTGLDLTEAFCEAATAMSDWLGLADKVSFRQGDATELPFEDARFDAAMTIHVAMNIAAKDRVYAQARRVLKPGGIFAVYDVLQGEGGDVIFPVPWAREPSISHLATPAEMETLLTGAGFRILAVEDSTEESHAWFAARMAALAEPPPVTPRILLGADYPQMVQSQVRNLVERRIRTVSYVCQA